MGSLYFIYISPLPLSPPGSPRGPIKIKRGKIIYWALAILPFYFRPEEPGGISEASFFFPLFYRGLFYFYFTRLRPKARGKRVNNIKIKGPGNKIINGKRKRERHQIEIK